MSGNQIDNDTINSKVDETEKVDASNENSDDNNGGGGAYNPDTGEINWDCPCLGGMAHGPCGEEFKAAFSCFVYSDAEPKGIDCVEAFKGMQDCFRSHPEHYSDEIDEDNEPSQNSNNNEDNNSESNKETKAESEN